MVLKHFGVFWKPWGHFLWFWRLLETGWSFDVFWDLPMGPQDPVGMELEGKKSIDAIDVTIL